MKKVLLIAIPVLLVAMSVQAAPVLNLTVECVGTPTVGLPLTFNVYALITPAPGDPLMGLSNSAIGLSADSANVSVYTTAADKLRFNADIRTAGLDGDLLVVGGIPAGHVYPNIGFSTAAGSEGVSAAMNMASLGTPYLLASGKFLVNSLATPIVITVTGDPSFKYFSDTVVPTLFGSENIMTGSVTIPAVPEPATLVLLAVGGLGLIKRRRR